MASKRRFVSISERIRQLRPDADPELLISAGLVEVDRRQVTNPRMLVSISSSVRLKATKDLRGATKLRGALDVLALDVRDSVALDVGAAAGGFTWALLQAGVRHVYAVDIGYGQLVGFLRQSPHVTVLERTNLAELTPHLIPERLDLITLDLSYLSLASAAPQLNGLDMSPQAKLIALVKPMFELGLSHLPSAAMLPDAVASATEGVSSAGWTVLSVVRSPVLGTRGAIEYFLHAVRERYP